MYIVYILKSKKDPFQHYIGLTQNLDQRLKEHNNSESGYTKKYLPWDVETYIVFKDDKKARSFERYLKEGSGHAFLKRHLI